MPHTIIVSGTPGTGKTTVAKALAATLGFEYLDGKAFAQDNQLYESYDEKRECYVVDTPAFLHRLSVTIADTDVVVDSHIAHEIAPRYADVIVITTCERKELAERLRARRYDEKKVADNIEAEIFDTCFIEAQEAGHQKILKYDTSSKTDKKSTETIEALARKITSCFS